MTKVTSCRPLTFSCFETMHEVAFQFETKPSKTQIGLDESLISNYRFRAKK